MLFLATPDAASRTYRSLQDYMYFEPVVAVGDAFVQSAEHTLPAHYGEKPACGGGAVVLPENVMILTVEKQPPAGTPDNAGKRGHGGYTKSKIGPTVLLRVAHRFGIGEDAVLSRPASVALADLFCAVHLEAPLAVEELSLSGNQPLSEMLAKKRRWQREGGRESESRGRLQRGKPQGPGKTVVLAPLQIRTFLLHYAA